MKIGSGFAAVVVALCLCFPSHAEADVFASGIHFTNPDSGAFDGSTADGTGLRINYLLNDTTSAVTIRVHNGSTDAVVHTIMLGVQYPGWNNVAWDGTGAGSSGTYYVTIEATQVPRSSSTYQVYYFLRVNGTDQAIFSRGVDVVRNQSNPEYGYAYTANAGGPLLRGLCRYSADGSRAGTNPGSATLTPALSVIDGGTIPWSADESSPNHATTDYLGRVYASEFVLGEIYRMENSTSTPVRVISAIDSPRGMAAVGEGADFKLYIAAGSSVLRANLGTSDSLTTPLDTIAKLSRIVRDVIFDDNGFMYVNVRNGSGWSGTPGGATEQYDISGTLPVTTANFLWSLPWLGYPVGLGHWSGADPNSAEDDLLYVSARREGSADAPGIHVITQLHDPFGLTRTHVWKPDDLPGLSGGGDVSRNADMTVDPAGNVIFFENGNEEIIFLSPPSSAPTVSHTTKSSGSIAVTTTSVNDRDAGLPEHFVLEQNYPNPFNPETVIGFAVSGSGFVRLAVYDVLGREVASLLNQHLEAGSYQVMFNASGLGAGTYLYRLSAGGGSETKKMILAR